MALTAYPEANATRGEKKRGMRKEMEVEGKRGPRKVAES